MVLCVVVVDRHADFRRGGDLDYIIINYIIIDNNKILYYINNNNNNKNI